MLVGNSGLMTRLTEREMAMLQCGKEMGFHHGLGFTRLQATEHSSGGPGLWQSLISLYHALIHLR